MPQTNRQPSRNAPEQVTSRLSFDPRTRRYRSRNGQFVGRAAVRREAQRIANESGRRLTILTEQLRDGRISLPEWAIRFRQEIKAGHSLTYTLARGGRAQMSAADWGRVGRLTRFHLGALDRYTSQLANGGLINFGRVRMYAAAIRNTFENAGRSIRLLDEQMPWARWIRTADESCPGCLAQASMPPRRLEDIPPIGSQECAANCRCYLEITPNLLGL